MAAAQVHDLPTPSTARIGHIRKFCARPKDRAVVLRLITTDEDAMPLGEWTRDEAIDNAEIPREVDELLQDHARARRAAVRASLQWEGEDGEVVVAKRLAVPALLEGDELEEPRRTASTEDLMILHMQMLERRERQYMERSDAQSRALAQLVDRLGSMLENAHKQNHQTHVELDKQRIAYRRELERLIEAETPETLEGQQRAELVQMVSQGLGAAMPAILQGLVQMGAAKLMGVQAPPVVAAQAPAPAEPPPPPPVNALPPERPTKPPPKPADKPASAPAPFPPAPSAPPSAPKDPPTE